MVSYRNQKILITGATGFIGGRLAERLVFEHGADVRVLVRDWKNAVWLSRLPVNVIEGDVRDRSSLAPAMAGCDVVFHCVGIGGDAQTCWETNVRGTENVLNAAAAASVKRVVYLSSSAVHGPNPPENADESAPLVRTGAPYGDSKVAAEEVIAAFRRQHTLPLVVLRPTFVWGPRSEWFTVDPIRQIRQGTWQLVDRGKGSCHAVHVDNLVGAMMLAGQVPAAAGEAFLITDDQPYTWGQFFLSYARMIRKRSLPSISSRWVHSVPVANVDRLFERMLRLLGDHMPALEPFRFLGRVVHFGIRQVRRAAGTHTDLSEWDLLKYSRRGRLDISKARVVLGYRASVSIPDGMRGTEEWLRDQRIIA